MTVRRYIQGLNRPTIECGRTVKLPAIRLSDTEVIKMALRYAADLDALARKQGPVITLDDC